MRKKIQRFIPILGIFLLIYLILKIDLSKAFQIVINFDLVWLCAYILSYSLMVLMKSLRWITLLKEQKINYRLGKVIFINLNSNYWGSVTPGRFGEFIKLNYLANDNIPSIKSLVNVLIDRSFDVVLLLIFGIIGIVYFSSIFADEAIRIVILFCLFSAVSLIIFLFRKNIKKYLMPALSKVLPNKSYEQILIHWENFVYELKTIKVYTYFKMLGYSIFIFFLFFIMTKIIANGLNVKVPFYYLSLCISMASLISLLPISIGGMGTREAVFIVLLGKIFVDKESAMLIAFLDSTVLGNLLAVLFLIIGNLFLKANMGHVN